MAPKQYETTKRQHDRQEHCGPNWDVTNFIAQNQIRIHSAHTCLNYFSRSLTIDNVDILTMTLDTGIGTNHKGMAGVFIRVQMAIITN
jgi:hypothetical protein